MLLKFVIVINAGWIGLLATPSQTQGAPIDRPPRYQEEGGVERPSDLGIISILGKGTRLLSARRDLLKTITSVTG